MCYILGVHKFAPVPGLYVDTGLLKPREHRFVCLFNYWNRLIKMDENRLTKQVFNLDFSICNSNWSYDIKMLFELLQLDPNIYESKKTVSVPQVNNKLIIIS